MTRGTFIILAILWVCPGRAATFADGDCAQVLRKTSQEFERMASSYSLDENPLGVTKSALLKKAQTTLNLNGVAAREDVINAKPTLVLEPGRFHVLNRFAQGLKEKLGVDLLYDPHTLRDGVSASHSPSDGINYLSHKAIWNMHVDTSSLHETVHAWVTNLGDRGGVSLYHADIRNEKAKKGRKDYTQYMRLDELPAFAYSMAHSAAELKRALKRTDRDAAFFVKHHFFSLDSDASVSKHVANHTQKILRKVLQAVKEQPLKFVVTQDSSSVGNKVVFWGHCKVDGYAIRMKLAVGEKKVHRPELDEAHLRERYLRRIETLAEQAEQIFNDADRVKREIDALEARIKFHAAAAILGPTVSEEDLYKREITARMPDLFELAIQPRLKTLGQIRTNLNEPIPRIVSP